MIVEQKMKKQSLCIILVILIGYWMCSCSDKDSNYDEIISVGKTTLSISLNSSIETSTRSSGNLDYNNEKIVNSITVLVFKSNTGELDGYKTINREIIDATGQSSKKEYKEIDEVSGIAVTAGERDIYVVANAPDNFFSSVVNFSSFSRKYEELSTQASYKLLGEEDTILEEAPIGGVNISDQKTNLTMCSYLENILLDNTQKQHYLGYTENEGRPIGISEGSVINAGRAFELERLVARVAIRKIEFDLPPNLEFEIDHPTNEYTYQIDSVFMLNVKTASTFCLDTLNKFSDAFACGNIGGIDYLNNTNFSSQINSKNNYVNYLSEVLSTREYDISVNDRPLWFYVFENKESTQYPTSVVIGVKFNFRSSIDNKIKTVKSFYPIVVNAKGISNGVADHNYIQRNYQYSIGVTITGLGSFFNPSNITMLRLASKGNKGQDIELEERVGTNLFPWIGNTYY